jgi:hypothetical protein
MYRIDLLTNFGMQVWQIHRLANVRRERASVCFQPGLSYRLMKPPRVIIPPHSLTRFIRNFAPLVQVEHGAIVQPFAV